MRRFFLLRNKWWLVAAIFFTFSWASPAQALLRFNELMYDPVGPDEAVVRQQDGSSKKFGREWVEIYNDGPEPTTIIGGGLSNKNSWRFVDRDGAHLLAALPTIGSLTIQPNDYLILAADANIFLQEHPGFSGNLVDTVMNLRNDQGVLQLLDGKKIIIADVFYTANLGAAGNGRTLEWDGGALREGFREGGSPGQENSVANVLLPQAPSPLPVVTLSPKSSPSESPVVLPAATSTTLTQSQKLTPLTVVVSEFLPNPKGLDRELEWIELANLGPNKVDVSGWHLETESSNKGFELSGALAPYGFQVIERTLSGLSLRNSGDQIQLFDSNGQNVFEIAYHSEIPEGWSAARLGNIWQLSNSPTPGKPNLPKEESPEKENIVIRETVSFPEVIPQPAQVSGEPARQLHRTLGAGILFGVGAALLAIFLKRKFLPL